MLPIRQELFFMTDSSFIANTKVKEAQHIGAATTGIKAAIAPQKSKLIFLKMFLIFKENMTEAATTNKHQQGKR